MGKYSTFKDKDKETVHSLLFDALRVEPFDPVKELVVQLLEVGVPVAIKDEVFTVCLCHMTSSSLHTGWLYTPGSSSETKMSTGCYYKFNGVR